MYAIQWPETNQGFQELDFLTVAELGFNYLRLPLDYRAYTAAADWLSFDQASLGRLDWAIAWGQEYGVHVDLCLHRAPGYCSHDFGGRIVTLPSAQDVDLWTDESAQAAFVAHWQMFAERYRTVGNEYLSFNLVNEPPAVELGSYTTLMTRAIDAIRAISPDRLIVVDGLDYARQPVDDAEFLRLPNVIQSKHSWSAIRPAASRSTT
jgi:endoglucanase